MNSEKYQQGKVIITQLVSLLEFAYFRNNYRLIASDLSKQTQEQLNRLIFLYILEQSKETMLQFSEGTIKVLWIIRIVEYSKVKSC